jgi:hypothetical protein
MNKKTLVAIIAAVTCVSFFLPWISTAAGTSPLDLVRVPDLQSSLPGELLVAFYLFMMTYLFFAIVALLGPIDELSPKFAVLAGVLPFFLTVIGLAKLSSATQGMISIDAIPFSEMGIGIVLYFIGSAAVAVLGVMMMIDKSRTRGTAGRVLS